MMWSNSLNYRMFANHSQGLIERLRVTHLLYGCWSWATKALLLCNYCHDQHDATRDSLDARGQLMTRSPFLLSFRVSVHCQLNIFAFYTVSVCQPTSQRDDCCLQMRSCWWEMNISVLVVADNVFIFGDVEVRSCLSSQLRVSWKQTEK